MMKQEDAIKIIFDESNRVCDRAWNLQLAPPGHEYYSEEAHKEFSEALKRVVLADKALRRIISMQSTRDSDV